MSYFSIAKPTIENRFPTKQETFLTYNFYNIIFYSKIIEEAVFVELEN